MLNESSLKIGTCIGYFQNNNKYYEGVICDIKNDNKPLKYKILWFIKQKDLVMAYCFFKIDKVDFEEIQEAEILTIPHFCSIDNLYEVLQKYTKYDTQTNTYDNKLKLLGVQKYKDEPRRKNAIFYFKTEKGFLELFSIWSKEDKESYCYLKEIESLDDIDRLRNSINLVPDESYSNVILKNFIPLNYSLESISEMLNIQIDYIRHIKKELEERGDCFNYKGVILDRCIENLNPSLNSYLNIFDNIFMFSNFNSMDFKAIYGTGYFIINESFYNPVNFIKFVRMMKDKL